jgi:hypothetical protein
MLFFFPRSTMCAHRALSSVYEEAIIIIIIYFSSLERVISIVMVFIIILLLLLHHAYNCTRLFGHFSPSNVGCAAGGTSYSNTISF